MPAITIKEARACLGRLVDKAEKGQSIVITRRGRRSARLVPMPKRARGLESLREFRSSIAPPRGGLAAAVMAARDEERF